MKTPARGILAVAVAVAATATLASPAAAAPNTRETKKYVAAVKKTPAKSIKKPILYDV